MARPLIGITSCLSSERCADLSPEYPFYHVYAWYCEAIWKAGGRAVILPSILGSTEGSEAEELLSRLEGVYITGGGLSTAPSRDAPPKLMGTQPVRSEVECAIIRECRRVKIPLIGSCRGHQMICESLCGALSENTLKEHAQKLPYYHPSHFITIEKDSKLAQVVGSEDWAVNSMHCQYVERCPAGFMANAYGPEQIIEGMEAVDPEWFCISFQYHPEIMIFDQRALRLMRAFVEAAGKYSYKGKDGLKHSD